MVTNSPLDVELGRLRVVLAGMVAGLLFLAVMLGRVQVMKAAEYRTSLDRQSMRRVRLPGARGLILDRHGQRLADNRACYSIGIYMEELRQPGRWRHTVKKVEEVIAQLSQTLRLPNTTRREDIQAHSRSLPMPFIVWKDVGEAVLARWAESGTNFPGVDICVEPVRTYPKGALAAHVIGYVTRVQPEQDESDPYHYYYPEMEGRSGLEQSMNLALSGTPGGRLIRVYASGFRYEDVAEREPRPGDNVFLTTDVAAQSALEQALGAERGAGVVIDPRNGDVLAMASSPSFDLNTFIPSASREDYRRLAEDEDKPFFNRAIAGAYTPGSIFKPVVVLAALESQRVTAHTIFECPGHFAIGSQQIDCWQRTGHGWQEMREAIEQSCNAYFCNLGMKCGHERIYHMAEAIGLGTRTGIELGGEAAGLIPDSVWKRRLLREGWYPGDTCNMSIGQGAVAVTPLQMAMFVAAIANGGLIFRPRLVLRAGPEAVAEPAGAPVEDGELVKRMAWSAESLRVVREGMHDVIEAPTGTGRRAQVPGIRMAGKTGTAEYGPRSSRRKHGWMIAYAPYESPRYAVAMVIEEAESGGRTVAPRIRTLMASLFGVQLEPPEQPATGEEVGD